MHAPLLLQVISSGQLSPAERAEILDLCYRAYEEDLESILSIFIEPVHVLARLDGRLVSHALWVTRWLQPGGLPVLRTAFVEAVATDPDLAGRGFASRVMSHLAEAITAYDLGGLSPAPTSLYARLGWEYWRGPCSIRTDEGLLPTPEARVMVLRLPKTPPDLDPAASLSAEWRPGELW